MSDDNVIIFPGLNNRIRDALFAIAENVEFRSTIEKLPDGKTTMDMVVKLPNGKDRRYLIDIDAETEA